MYAVVGADPDAGVADRAVQAPVADSRRDLDLAARRELHRVVEQQEEDLRQLREVGPDLRKALVDALLDHEALVADRVLYAEDRLGDRLPEVHVLDLDGQLALLDAPEVEDVLERAQEGGAVVQRRAQARLRGLGEALVLAGQHRDDRLDDAVERRAQLPRHLLDEVVLQLLDLAELLVRAQQLDVLREERLGELEDLLAALVVTAPEQLRASAAASSAASRAWSKRSASSRRGPRAASRARGPGQPTTSAPWLRSTDEGKIAPLPAPGLATPAARVA
jgi:hypothetical protein